MLGIPGCLSVHGRKLPLKPIDICITIDTEFSLGGMFQEPGAEPIADERVFCNVDGEERGLGFLLDTFAKHGTKATFFIEALHPLYFGLEPMGRAMDRILGAGQDVQLHLHPLWMGFHDPNWRLRKAAAPMNDDLDGRTQADIEEMITLGMKSFKDWGAPTPLAMRASQLRVDRTVYRAMANKGLKLASNVGLGIFEPHEEALRLTGGRALIEGVLELPVLTYRQFTLGALKRQRLFAITATSATEASSLLEQAWKAQISPIVIMTHPFEFVRFFDGKVEASPNRINASRLEAICQKVSGDPSRFRARSFAEAASDWASLPPLKIPELVAPPMATAIRLIVNKMNDTIRWF